jgi:hypothetical protein
MSVFTEGIDWLIAIKMWWRYNEINIVRTEHIVHTVHTLHTAHTIYNVDTVHTL